MTTLILPGVGGSEPAHWQSWLETQLVDAKRVEQADWNSPVLHTWRQSLDRELLLNATEPVWIVAHSFGCLVTMSALSSRVLASKVAGVLLVAPASPERFSLEGFARSKDQAIDPHAPQAPALLSRILPRAPLGVPIRLIASRTDPWMTFEAAEWWATRWGAKLIDLGDAGHINVAAGFGAWPQVIKELNTLKYGSQAVKQFATRHLDGSVIAKDNSLTDRLTKDEPSSTASDENELLPTSPIDTTLTATPIEQSASNQAAFGQESHGIDTLKLLNKQVV
ncbi:RBBP9/YdeN family alpha/beta hydrolase [Aquirhabdus parva]|uniref:Alpha/beta hydrolase n=1 Tax=Aquirhabdus parva TaxID=2283318 RepID=A0A345P8U7_9GAMM|nr:alpha/beta hydrolase [Aquirhabdus parva]AXI03706.1 alpha/beta hydrolase [Aquirhabdus parva]